MYYKVRFYILIISITNLILSQIPSNLNHVKLKSGSISFKSYFKKLPVPFKIYAVFECLLKGVKSSDKNIGLYTEKYQDHIL